MFIYNLYPLNPLNFDFIFDDNEKGHNSYLERRCYRESSGLQHRYEIKEIR